MVYCCSLLEEEGRYPRFRVIADSGESPPYRLAVKFSPRIGLSEADDLRKLAPALADPVASALWVVENPVAGGFLTPGILEVRHVSAVDRTSPWMGPGQPADRQIVDALVRGPGWLAVGIGWTGFADCRGGRLRWFEPLIAAPPVATLFLELEEQLQRLAPCELWKDVGQWWRHVLDLTRERRHGGTFLFVPDVRTTPDKVRSDYGLSDGHNAELDFGMAIANFRKTCLRLAGEPEPHWPVMRETALRTAKGLSALANVDGCVVLDRSLNVHLFGAKIGHYPQLRPLRDWEDHEKEIALDGLGTRNQSASRVCAAHAGAIAFVVSQDGDVRLYCSDDQFAYGFEGIG